jgi:hypothetical protein
MKILDNNNNLLAVVIKFDQIVSQRDFYTENNLEMQVGSFNLSKGEIISNHFHLTNNRKISVTAEVLVVLEGELLVKIYDDKNKFIKSVNLKTKDSILLYKGGHGIEILKDAKFIEAKQGPYDINTDKEYF